MADPIMTLKLTGRQEVTEFEDSYTWTKEGQYEQEFYIKSTDGAITLDYSLVDNIRAMVFRSASDFTVTIATATANIPFTVQDVFMFTPDTVLAALITAITVETASTTDQTINVQIFGEEA